MLKPTAGLSAGLSLLALALACGGSSSSNPAPPTVAFQTEAVDTVVGSAGATSLAENLSATTVQAWVPGPTPGTFTGYPASANGAGLVSVPDLNSAQSFILVLQGAPANAMFNTSTAQFTEYVVDPEHPLQNIGTAEIGRKGLTVATQKATTLDLAVTGQTLAPDSNIEMVDSDAGGDIWDENSAPSGSVTSGQTAGVTNLAVAWQGYPLLDSTDSLSAIYYVPFTVSGHAGLSAAAYAPISITTMTDGSTTTAPVDFSSLSQHTFGVYVDGSAFAARIPATNMQFSSATFSVRAETEGTNGQLAAKAWTLYRVDLPQSAVAWPNQSYGAPGNFANFYTVAISGTVPVSYPGSTTAASIPQTVMEEGTDTPPSAAAPIGPNLLPASNIVVGDLPVVTGSPAAVQAGIGLTPMVAWQMPVSCMSELEVDEITMDSNGATLVNPNGAILDAFTDQNQAIVAPGILQAGHMYAFFLRHYTGANASTPRFVTAPFSAVGEYLGMFQP